MITLKAVDFSAIQNWFVDYQKKSKNFEMPPDHGQIIGIFRGEELVGYFILVCYKDRLIVEINQGYLKPDARHKKNNYIAMKLLEDLVKKNGYKHIVLATNRAVGSYQRFMHSLGFSLVRAEFAKQVE